MTTNGNNSTPTLYGLVLAGGRSTRMGQDKSTMQWHGKEQRYYAADLLARFCAAVYISCRADQQNEIDPGYKTLPDNVDGAGPVVAILSALEAHPNIAWLVIACDMPLLDAQTLQYLCSHRDTACVATTFKSPHDGLPEPLITIWEPGSYAILSNHVAEGYRCPRKALIRNSERVNLLEPPYPEALINANTPEDVERVKQLLHQG